ncbi:putative GNAT family acetyltransferase [Metabacillus crassostreae]|uniref:GNAT family N-acetyltransferase n=1 Tax=Metabacillus crassostreae TaxID=929098 RepID=UPI00195980B2|nr:GNAT family N-acetyltransferase [Metabacillus crassostreae]MBM7602395.1 putative GNAT family acetyltransferase [Metabacillus crassostreae]
MIRRLNKEDHESVMMLIGHKPAENLFILGDIEAFGYDSDIQEIWGQFQHDKLIAILLRYDQNYIPFSEQDYDVKGFAEIINHHSTRFELSGLKHVVEPIKGYINREVRKHSETYYAKCTGLSYKVDNEKINQATYLQSLEYQENIEMLCSIPEFALGNFSIESRERAEKYKTGRTYIVRNEEGEMVASASTTAENSQSAMIVGVGTKPSFERRGYATLCMEKLCSELLAEGKSLCLFYDNPAAGKIYKRLGFSDIGLWTMIRYEGLE